MPSESELRDRFHDGTLPSGQIDVDAVLRRARARRRPRVLHEVGRLLVGSAEQHRVPLEGVAARRDQLGHDVLPLGALRHPATFRYVCLHPLRRTARSERCVQRGRQSAEGPDASESSGPSGSV